MVRFSALSLLAAAVVALAACDTAGASTANSDAFDPSTVDYDARTRIDFEADVRPLLAARNVLSPTATLDPGDPADYSLDALVMAGPSGFVVPFDAEGSLLVRFTRDLADTTAIPFPNLRRLEADERRFVERWIEGGARDGDRIPFADARRLLFACVQGENTVDVLDAETLRIVRRVRFDALGFPSAPYGPHHVAFEPGGGAWYVSLISTGAVLKLSTSLTLDPASREYVLGSVRTTTPGMLALDPSSDRLFVGRSTLSASTTSGFVILDRRAMTATEVATPFNVPHAMAVTRDGRFVLTASLTGGQVAVYDTVSEDLAITTVPGGPHELIHFAVLGAHHAATVAPAGHAGMDHGQMDHSQMNHGAPAATGAAADPAHAYEATLTSKSTGTVLFFSLSASGALALTATAPAGNGPYHAHVGHDGRTMFVPNQRGNTVTILDAVTRESTRTVSASAPAGPLSQPHSPAPGHDGARFYVSSSNLTGRWVPPYAFLGPPDADGARAPLPAARFSNVAAFSIDGAVLGVVQLGTYASGLEPFTVGVGGHESGM